MKALITVFALALPTYLAADGAITTKITPFVEKAVVDANGATKFVLAEPNKVYPGDKIVYVLSYHNGGAAAATNFAITDPIPHAIEFDSTPDASALVSVDGGKSYGLLANLKVAGANGALRAARPEDVTHVRWAMKSAVPAGGEGKVSFRGTVK